MIATFARSLPLCLLGLLALPAADAVRVNADASVDFEGAIQAQAGAEIAGHAGHSGPTGNSANKLRFDSSTSVYAEQFVTTWGNGGGLMFNATYGGGDNSNGDPIENAAFAVEPGTYNTAAGYLDFDGNGKLWRMLISDGPSTGKGDPVSWKTPLTVSRAGVHVGGVLEATGDCRIEGGLETSGRGKIGRYLAVMGTDIQLGLDDGRNVGSKRDQRALVHWDGSRVPGSPQNDTLVINYDGDFEGGVILQGYGVYVPGRIYVGGDIFKDGAAYAHPDYVFEPDYELRDLTDVADFVTNHKHLPGIPSRADVEADGLNMSEMQRLHLEKIEELTLYAIAAERERDAALARVAKLEAAHATVQAEQQKMEARLRRLEALLIEGEAQP